MEKERCIKQHVQNANKNVKFHLNLQKVSPYIVGIVLEKKEDISTFK